MTGMYQLFQNLTLLAGLVTAASFIPQIWRIHRTKSAGDLSLATFGLWVIIPAINIFYLWLQHDIYLLIALTIGWLASLATFVQAVYYRTQPVPKKARR